MLTYLWPTTAAPRGLSSFWGLLQGQFLDFRAVLRVTEWFRPREFWPPTLPPDYLATAPRPTRFLLLRAGVCHLTTSRPPPGRWDCCSCVSALPPLPCRTRIKSSAASSPRWDCPKTPSGAVS